MAIENRLWPMRELLGELLLARKWAVRCDGRICEERAADGVTVTRRVFAVGEQVGGSARFFAADHLGSVTDVTDASAGSLARYAFDPWGRRALTSLWPIPEPYRSVAGLLQD